MDEEIALEGHQLSEAKGELRVTKTFTNPNKVTPLRERDVRNQYVGMTNQDTVGQSSVESMRN